MTEKNSDNMKRVGFIKQRQKDTFSIRLRIPAGEIDSDKLRKIADIADEYGRGYVHLTTRQGIQIPWIGYESLDDARDLLIRGGVKQSACGPRMRNIIACPGLQRCQFGIMDSIKFGMVIDEKYFGKDLPHKFKIAVSGCSNSCAKPQENDMGFFGVLRVRVVTERCVGCGLCETVCKDDAIRIENGKSIIDYSKCTDCILCHDTCPTKSIVEDKRGWAVLVGGKIGRHPQLAYELTRYVDDDTAMALTDRVLEAYAVEGMMGERFGSMIKRMGIKKFREMILK